MERGYGEVATFSENISSSITEFKALEFGLCFSALCSSFHFRRTALLILNDPEETYSDPVGRTQPSVRLRKLWQPHPPCLQMWGEATRVSVCFHACQSAFFQTMHSIRRMKVFLKSFFNACLPRNSATASIVARDHTEVVYAT